MSEKVVYRVCCASPSGAQRMYRGVLASSGAKAGAEARLRLAEHLRRGWKVRVEALEPDRPADFEGA